MLPATRSSSSKSSLMRSTDVATLSDPSHASPFAIKVEKFRADHRSRSMITRTQPNRSDTFSHRSWPAATNATAMPSRTATWRVVDSFSDRSVHQKRSICGSRGSSGSRRASRSATIDASSSVDGRRSSSRAWVAGMAEEKGNLWAVIARRVRTLPGMKAPRSIHRLALSPVCWGISDVPGWGHQLDAERVLSEAAAVGEGAIEAGPPGFLPDRSDLAKPMLKRHHLRVVSGSTQAILHHHDISGAELAALDGHASWLAALGAETLVLSPVPPRDAGDKHGIVLSSTGWAHLLHLIGSVQHVCSRHKLRLAVQPRYGSMIQGPSDIERLLVGTEALLCIDVG